VLSRIGSSPGGGDGGCLGIGFIGGLGATGGWPMVAKAAHPDSQMACSSLASANNLADMTQVDTRTSNLPETGQVSAPLQCAMKAAELRCR